MRDGHQFDGVVRSPERRMHIGHVVDESRMLVDVDARVAGRHEQHRHVMQQQRRAAVAVAGHGWRHRDRRVVDARREPPRHG